MKTYKKYIRADIKDKKLTNKEIVKIHFTEKITRRLAKSSRT